MSEYAKVMYAILACYQDRLKLEKIRSMPGYSNYSTRLRKRLEAKIEELRNLELELKKAAKDPDFVRRLEQSAVRKAMEHAEKHSQEQQRKREKRQTWKGLKPEQRTERNRRIFEHFRKTHLSKNNFADKHAAKYSLKPSAVRSILSTTKGI